MATTQRVAVIGAGVQGLCAAKNLLELNNPKEAPLFEVAILESRQDGLGGVWRLSDDPQTVSVTSSTLVNVSFWRNCFSDFPIPEAFRLAALKGDPRVPGSASSAKCPGKRSETKGTRRRVDGVPVFLMADELLLYLEMYAEKFDLVRYIEYGVRVGEIIRDEANKAWEIRASKDVGDRRSEDITRKYDKIIIATGQWNTPFIPPVPGIDGFTGTALHSIAYKHAEHFKDRNVLVVGFSNTAVDTAIDLVGHAKSIRISHRKGIHVFPRVLDGLPLDTQFTRRMHMLLESYAAVFPLQSAKYVDKALDDLTRRAAGGEVEPQWRILPAPSAMASYPVVSETLFDHLRSGAVESVAAIAAIEGDGRFVELVDGTKLEGIDTIIFATGYESNNTIKMPIIYSGEPRLPRMYMNIFHPDHPTSFATTSMWEVATGVCEGGDLVTMAIAQVFAGSFQLPTKEAMEKAIDKFHASNRALKPLGFGTITSEGRNVKSILNNEGPWRSFLYDAAGTGLNEKLGWGLQGWLFWARQPRLCHTLMAGVSTPAAYRLFETGRKGGRKPWPGARREIEAVDRQFKEFCRLERGKV